MTEQLELNGKNVEEEFSMRGGKRRRRSCRKRRGGSTRKRRGGSALAQMAVPFGLIALQQVIGESQNQRKLRNIDRSLGRPGTSVIKGAVNVGSGVVRTGLGVVQSVLPGGRTKRRKPARKRKSARKRR